MGFPNTENHAKGTQLKIVSPDTVNSGEKVRRRGWSLSTTDSIRRRLARILQSLNEAKEMSAAELGRARTLIYGFSILAAILKGPEAQDLEQRIAELEKLPKAKP